jgi:hypothetical protein
MIVNFATTPKTVVNWTSLLCGMMDKTAAFTNSASDTTGNVNTRGFRKVMLCPEVTAVAAEFDPNDPSVTHYLSHPRLMPILNSEYSSPPELPDNYLRNFGGDPTAVMKCYKLSKLKRSAEIATVFDGSLSLLTSAGNYSNYSGQPYYRPRQNMPVGDLISKRALGSAQTALIADWPRTSYKPDQPVDMTPVDASGQTPPVSFVNKDLDGNDRNFRFRHGRSDTLNALMGDMHVTTFQTSKKRLTSTPPNGGSLQNSNIFLDRP